MQYENAVGGIVGAFEIAHHLLIVEKSALSRSARAFSSGIFRSVISSNVALGCCL